MAPTLKIRESRRDGGAVTMSLLGELDLCSGAELAVRLADAGRPGNDVVVDLRGLEFIDSAGMGVLHRAAGWAGDEGWRLSITGPRPNVRRVLRLTGLDGT